MKTLRRLSALTVAITLTITVTVLAPSIAAADSPPLLLPGAWKIVGDTTVVTDDGKKKVSVGKVERAACLSPQFVANNPHFNADFAMRGQSSQAKSCRYWPITQSLTATTGVLRMRFECTTTDDKRVWATVDNIGTPTTVDSKLRVFKQGGAGHVDLTHRMTRMDAACPPEMKPLESSPVEPQKAARPTVVVTQPSVNFAGETYFYDGAEMGGTAIHNNYYRAEESSTDWRKEFSASHYPNSATPAAYVARLADSDQRVLLKGTSTVTLEKSSDGQDVTTAQLFTAKRDNGVAFVMHSTTRIVQRVGVKGVKTYRLETDYDEDKVPSVQAMAALNQRYADALSSIDLPVYDAEGKALATSANVAKPILFNGQTFRLDTGTVALTHIFNGYALDGEDANTAARSLWVNVYPTADTTSEVIEWTKAEFSGKLLKGSKFESLNKTPDGSSETLLYILPTADGTGFVLSIARYTKDQDGVKAYRYNDSFNGTMVEHGASIRASMRKIAALLGELSVPVVNEARTSEFAVPPISDEPREATKAEMQASSAIVIDKKTYQLKNVREQTDEVANYFFTDTETITEHTSNLTIRLETNERDPVSRCQRVVDSNSQQQVAGTKARVIRDTQNGKDVTCTVVTNHDKNTIAFFVIRLRKVSAPDAVLSYRYYRELSGSYAQNAAEIQTATEAVADQLARIDRRVIGKPVGVAKP